MAHHDSIDWKGILSPTSLALTILGVICAVIALKGFMIPNQFIDGGITGISILLSKFFHMDISILLVVLNIPFIYIGYKKIGKSFAVETTLAIILLIIGMNTLNIPIITNDKILIAIFGGFFIGLGIGFVIRAGGVLDGLEVVAHYTNKTSGWSTGEIVMLINTAVILAAVFQFGLEAGMYSILTYFTAMKISDYVVDGFEEYTALTVISVKHENMKSIIVNDFNKAISVFKGERGYLPGTYDVHHDCDIVMTIVTRLEIHRIRTAILNEDPNAFVYISTIKEVKGGVIKQKVKH
ncbi:MAG: YitT family protein [Bacteroidota bacterium]|nr:YitT family protein [Bacteroidota bacterium]